MAQTNEGGGWRSPVGHLLRNPPGSPKGQHTTNSAYAVERNPWTARDEVEAALFFRGVIVSAFANIEAQIGTLAVRLSYVPACRGIRANFPHRLKSRLIFLRSAFETEAFARFKSLADLFLERFERAANLRHIAAHAEMHVLAGWLVEFHHFPKEKGGVASTGLVTRRTEKIALADLEALAWRAANLSRLGQRLLGRLDATGLLPPLQQET